ncbi:MAG: radical SAM protein [Firmicutes bacterium]|nr:radical SAM protein [Bacillota bacterium]MCL2771303.1 radical SAM protein [Bacillota bacterium]
MKALGLEVTRICNLNCPGFCMRGKSQKLYMTKKIIDMALENKEIAGMAIREIFFSGGEPTLNPEIVVYTIDKIIKENLNVRFISMATNGQIYNTDIVEAFIKFSNFRNAQLGRLKSSLEEKKEELIKVRPFAFIRLSDDQFHNRIPKMVNDLYESIDKRIKIYRTGEREEKQVFQTGFANDGATFEYKPENYTFEEDSSSNAILYVTAKGDLTLNPNGAYDDMDEKNFGQVEKANIRELLVRHCASKKQPVAAS